MAKRFAKEGGLFHVEPYLKTFALVTICVKSGQSPRPERRGAVLGEWVLTLRFHRTNARRDSAPGPWPVLRGFLELIDAKLFIRLWNLYLLPWQIGRAHV